MKNDGGNAFPRQESEHYHGMDGMTLRDYFAGQVIIGILSSAQLNTNDIAQLSSEAYEGADAMIQQRDKDD